MGLPLIGGLDVREHTSSIVSLPAESLLLINSFLLGRALVARFGKPVCQVEQILWNADSIKKRALTFIKLVVGEEFLNALSHNLHL